MMPAMPNVIFYCTYKWEPSDLILAATDRGLCRIEFVEQMNEKQFLAAISPKIQVVKDEKPFAGLYKELDRYFSGQPVAWKTVLDISGGTDFQRLVWMYLRKIPYGHTVTYGQIGKELGKPGASRAIGAANGANPIPIVIPCHRVLAGAGKLGGYGGGLHIKQALLSLEGVLL